MLGQGLLRRWGYCCRVLIEEVEQARNMLQQLQNGLVYDDVQQLKVMLRLLDMWHWA